MDWRCQLADLHAIMWATTARDLSPRPPLLKERGRVGGMDWRCQLADIHAIMWATTARDLSPRPPLLKERGRVGGMDWRCQLADIHAIMWATTSPPDPLSGAGPLPPGTPSPKGKGEGWRYGLAMSTCRWATVHAIMWATTARDLSPRPPLLKERGRKAERCLTGVLYALGLTGKRHRGTFASPVRRPITVPPSFRKGVRG